RRCAALARRGRAARRRRRGHGRGRVAPARALAAARGPSPAAAGPALPEPERMRVTQEADRIPGQRLLATAAGLVALTAAGVLAAYYIMDCRVAALSRAQPPAVYIEPAPRFEPAPIGQVPEEVNAIEQVLFRERAPGLEERAAERTTLRSYAWA